MLRASVKNVMCLFVLFILEDKINGTLKKKWRNVNSRLNSVFVCCGPQLVDALRCSQIFLGSLPALDSNIVLFNFSDTLISL